MTYYRRDGTEACGTSDGGFLLLVTRRGRIYERHVAPDDFVSQLEAAAILRPTVSRVAVHKWVKSRKLKDEKVDGISMISVQRLRQFAAKHGYGLAPLGPDE